MRVHIYGAGRQDGKTQFLTKHFVECFNLAGWSSHNPSAYRVDYPAVAIAPNFALADYWHRQVNQLCDTPVPRALFNSASSFSNKYRGTRIAKLFLDEITYYSQDQLDDIWIGIHSCNVQELYVAGCDKDINARLFIPSNEISKLTQAISFLETEQRSSRMLIQRLQDENEQYRGKLDQISNIAQISDITQKGSTTS